MPREEITIAATDGDCRSWVFTPSEGSGPWPAVIFYMDALAIRPALLDMAQQLADMNFVVLVPDLFYRVGPYEPMVPSEVFAMENPLEVFGPLMSSTGPHPAAEDTTSFLAYLDTRTDIAGTKVGATGYCMGGGMAIVAAAKHNDRIAAAASFHGGGLATDDDASPHKSVGDIKGSVYIGAADNDGHYPPAMAAALCEALMEAHVDFSHELYKDAAHGWTQADFPIYDKAAADRHWAALDTLFGATLV